MRHATLLLFALSLMACGGGGGGGGGGSTPDVTPPPVNQSVGGIWEGTDSDGDNIIGLVTEDGTFHFIDSLFGQGFGTASVRNGNQVQANFTYVAELDTALSDGSTSATCSLSGTVVERQTLTIDSECTSTLDNVSQVSVTLAYNALYDRNASLTTIEGLYDDSGDVLRIDSSGILFEQDASNGCVLNGQVSVIDPSYNAYDLAFSVENCVGSYEKLNGTMWSGIATLDNTASPEELVYGLVGDVIVSGQTIKFSLVGRAPRI